MELKLKYMSEDPSNKVNRKDPENIKKTLTSKLEGSYRGVDFVLTVKGTKGDVEPVLFEIGAPRPRDIIKARFTPLSRQKRIADHLGSKDEDDEDDEP